ncbi:N-acetyl-gamma-glutamyl-phosphate reductase [Echinicola sediminis]
MTVSKFKAAIVGASGYTGSELARILLRHPEVEIKMITSESHIGKSFSTLHPQFYGELDQPLSSAKEVDPDEFDIVFLALPHGVSMNYLEQWRQKKCRFVDLSGDFRLSGPEVYETWYGTPHTFSDAFSKAVYGLPELNEEDIRACQILANPGCYPTASILSLAPLFDAGLIVNGSVIIDAKSGITGAGIKPSATTHFSNVNDNFKAYGISNHRHTIEIEEQLGKLNGTVTPVQFTPHLLPVDRGILVTAYAQVKGGMNQRNLTDNYKQFYQNKPFVRLRNEVPSLKDVRGSNFCDVYPVWDSRTNRVIVLSAIDNLVKGAAGQAVHNMNLMLDLPEISGLQQLPLQP